MYLTGFTDEVGNDFDLQLDVTKRLGWKYIEARQIGPENLASLTDEGFDVLCGKLEESGIRINCFGSGVGNSANKITESPEKSYEEMRKAIPRMQKLGIGMIRMMSFFVAPEERPFALQKYLPEVISRVKTLVKMAEDGGILCVHENCVNFGGISYEHTLRLLDAIPSPNFKLVFDTGNPVFSDDVRGNAPYHKQDSFEFYKNVRDHIAYVHIKDAVMDGPKIVYVTPGEGNGHIKEIVEDLLRTGYDGGFSMEPHLLHMIPKDLPQEERQQKLIDAYTGACRTFEKLLSELKTKTA